MATDTNDTTGRPPYRDAGQGDGEARTEPYMQYGKGALEPTTPPSARSMSSAASSARKQAHAVRRSVLCIEDERFIGELYTRALQRAGYDIVVEADGQKGYELAKTDQFDIILLDLMLPSMTGSEILQRLRGPSAPTPHIRAKIIITTNLEQREEARTEIEKQADGYIVKAEVTPRQLAEFLQQLNV